jgi:cell division control protein 45
VLSLSQNTWFGEFSLKMTIHVIDSRRPRDLPNLFAAGENAERIIVWDDGGAEDLEEERKAWEAIEASR